MAVEKIPMNTSFRLVVQTGADQHGEPILTTRTYSRIKPNAQAADVFAVAHSIGDIQVFPVAAVQLTEQSTLMEN